MKLGYQKALLILPFLASLAFGISSNKITKAGGGTFYKTYETSKEEGSEQFDFEAVLPASKVKLDGKKDSVYVEPFLTFGGSGGKSVKAYSYHDTDALYLLFEVSDTNVLSQATSSSNAYNEDGIEIYIDPLADGGTSPRSDDIQLNLGISGFSRRLKGTGTGWKSASVYMEYEVSLMKNTTLNNESDTDEGYFLEAKFPFGILGVTNQSPIRITFAHADLNHLGDSRSWHGLSGRTDGYAVSSTTIPSEYLILSKNEKLYSKATYAESLVSNPIVAGKVSDGNKPLSNATVIGYSDFDKEEIFEVTTKEDGSYYFEDVNPSFSFHVSATKPGYNDFSYVVDSASLTKSMSSCYSKDITLYSKRLERVDVYGSISSISKNLENFDVYVEGDDNVAKTTSSGEFLVSVYKGVNNTIVISKNGFETTYIQLDAENAKKNGEVGTDIEMYPTLVNLGSPLSSNLSLNSATLYAQNYKSGLVVKAETRYEISGEEFLEFYINTGKTGYNSCFHTGDYKITYSENGLQVYAYNERSHEWKENSTKADSISVSTKIGNLVETTFFIPGLKVYGKNAKSVVGVAYRFNNGEAFEDSFTNATPDKKISPLDTVSYLRFDGSGKSFISFSNTDDLERNIMYVYGVDGASGEAIPENADKFYIYSSKDDEKVNFDIYVSNGFGMHNNPQYKLSGSEALNLILNIDDDKQTNWAMNTKNKAESCYDINFRIYSDDTICYVNSKDFANGASNQLWWSDLAHNNGVASNLTLDSKKLDSSKFSISEEEGFKKYSFSFTYDELISMCGDSSKKIDNSKAISFAAWEVSETSKTTIRFYETSGKNNYILNNKNVTQMAGALSNQANYYVIQDK